MLLKLCWCARMINFWINPLPLSLYSFHFLILPLNYAFGLAEICIISYAKRNLMLKETSLTLRNIRADGIHWIDLLESQHHLYLKHLYSIVNADIGLFIVLWQTLTSYNTLYIFFWPTEYIVREVKRYFCSQENLLLVDWCCMCKSTIETLDHLSPCYSYVRD